MKKVKNKSLLLLFTLVASLLTGCDDFLASSNIDRGSSNNEISSLKDVSSVANSSSYDESAIAYNNKPMRLFDGKHGENDNGYKNLDFKLAEFNETFCVKTNKLYDSKETMLSNGFLESLYLYDINSDGYREFCQTISSGSGQISYYVVVYDYHNNKTLYQLNNRGINDYFFYVENDELRVEKYPFSVNYYDSDGTGKLFFDRDKGAYVKWENNYKINGYSFSLNVSTDSEHCINYNKQDEIYTYSINSYCTYYLKVTVDSKNNEVKLPTYCPYTYNFIGSRFNFSKKKVKNAKDNEYYFEIYFNDGFGEGAIEIDISSFTKTIRFVRDESVSSTMKVRDLFEWSSLINENNVIKFAEDFELYLSSDGFRTIYPYSNKAVIKMALDFLDYPVYEIDPAFYLYSRNMVEVYHYYTADKCYSFEFDDKVFTVNNKHYSLRETPNFYTAGEADVLDYHGFVMNCNTLNIQFSDNNEIAETITDTQSFAFKKELNNNKYDFNNAEYCFTLVDKTYYIIDAKTFVDNKGQYYYNILSEQDFSFLFR